MKSLEFFLLKAARQHDKEHKFTGPRLREAIPFLNAFNGKTFVLKLGGSVLDKKENWAALIDDVVFLKKVGINLVLVHGGARQLDAAMKERDIPIKSKNGLRMTSKEVLELARKEFAKISQKLADEIKKRGFRSQVLGGDSGLVKSERHQDSELGYVGTPKDVNVDLLYALAEDVVPVVPAVTAGTKPSDIGFNVNADDVAGAIAVAIKAEKLILMTEVEGVFDEHKKLISSLTRVQVEDLIKKNVIKDGMIPKVTTCLNALKDGVHKCHIIKGNTDAFIDEILTNSGVGTEFIQSVDAVKIAI